MDLADQVEVVYAISPSPQRRRAFAERFAFALGDSLEPVLQDRSVEVAAVLTPPNTHLHIVTALARAGKHILLEKPLEVASERAEALVRVCADAGVTLGVVLQHRFKPAAERLAAILAAGGIVLGTGANEGKIALIRRRRYGPETALPKGKLAQGEDPAGAALREVREETGVEARPLGMVGVVSTVFEENTHTYLLWLMEPVAGDPNADGAEVDHCCFLPFEELIRREDVAELVRYLAGRLRIDELITHHSAHYLDDSIGMVVRSSPEPTFWPHDPERLCETSWARLVWTDLRDRMREAAVLACNDRERYDALADRARRRMETYAGLNAATTALGRALHHLERWSTRVPEGRPRAGICLPAGMSR